MRGPREAAVREVDALGGDGGQPCHSEKYQCDFLDVFHVDVSLSASCRRRRVYHNSRPNEALKMQIFREVYANVYFKAVFLANVYFTYTPEWQSTSPRNECTMGESPYGHGNTDRLWNADSDHTQRLSGRKKLVCNCDEMVSHGPPVVVRSPR